MAAFDPLPAARLLLSARRARRPLEPLPPEIGPRDEAEGAAVQFALASLVGAMPPAGFKVGATALRMQHYLGVSGPAAGFMASAGMHEDAAELPWNDFVCPGVECELAVRLGADLPPGQRTLDDAAAAVSEVFAAIEVVENRYGAGVSALASVGGPMLVADQFFHAAAVLGAPLERWRALDLASVAGRISVDGVERSMGRGGDLLGHPTASLAWLAGSTVAAAFGGLRAGQVVMLGSVTPPIWLDGPGHVTVVFDSFAPVTLRFV